MTKLFFGTVIIALQWTIVGAAETIPPTAPADGELTLENDLLRVVVSPVGARVVSLYDKVRQREDVKSLSYVGGINQIRYDQVLALDDTKDRFALTLSTLADGAQKVFAVGGQSGCCDGHKRISPASRLQLLAHGVGGPQQRADGTRAYPLVT